MNTYIPYLIHNWPQQILANSTIGDTFLQRAWLWSLDTTAKQVRYHVFVSPLLIFLKLFSYSN